MDHNEKTTAGAEIVSTYGRPKPGFTSHANPSMVSVVSSYTSPTRDPHSKDESDTASVHPFSPFYSHPTTRTSFEQRASESKVNIAIYQHDLESGSRIAQSTDLPRNRNDSTVWPCANQRAMLCRQNQSRWNPMRNLSKRQKIIVKILLALVIIGATVGLGIGIAMATGTGVWRNANSESPIGHDNPQR